MVKAGSFYTFKAKKQYIYEELTGQKEKKLAFGCSISEESNQSLGLVSKLIKHYRLVYIDFSAKLPISGDKSALLSPDSEKNERLVSAFRETERRLRISLFIGHFLSNFSSK